MNDNTSIVISLLFMVKKGPFSLFLPMFIHLNKLILINNDWKGWFYRFWVKKVLKVADIVNCYRVIVK